MIGDYTDAVRHIEAAANIMKRKEMRAAIAMDDQFSARFSKATEAILDHEQAVAVMRHALRQKDIV